MKPYYQDEACVIWHGDCRDILPTLDPVDHVMFDPPYSRDVYIRATGNNTKQGSRTPDRLYKGQSMAQLATLAIGEMDAGIIEAVAQKTARVRRWWLAFSDAESTHLWKEAAERAGLRYVRQGVWVKRNSMPQMSGDRPAVGHEPYTLCHAQGPMRWNGGGRKAVHEYPTNGGANRPDHPCPKPDGLMEELIALFTDPGEIILDAFMGSGTTLLAAKRLGRKAIGIELNEKYCEVAANRLRQSALDLFGTDPPATPGELDLEGYGHGV